MSTAQDPSPAERVSTPVDGVTVLGAISPSRAADFVSCPLAYRFRTIDKLPEPPSVDATRGTVVHKVLEDLFDLPSDDRTPARAESLVEPVWAAFLEQEPELAEMFGPDGADQAEWLTSCREVLTRYFALEDPRRLDPAEREIYVEHLLDSKLLLRGFVDRVDVAPDGAVRLVDYKSGKAPSEGFETRALFQLRFYALVWWRLHGVLPTQLQLLYLGSGEIIRYEPDEQDLEATRRKVEAIWAAIQQAKADREWLPNRGRPCDWCSHRAICPAWGGTPPPLPESPDVAVAGSVAGSIAGSIADAAGDQVVEPGSRSSALSPGWSRPSPR